MLSPSYHMALDLNEKGRDFVVGDIHGMYSVLMDTLMAVGFNTVTDRLIAVGDLIDRGPDSLECMRLLHKDWFFSVIGNHEIMMLDALEGRGDKGWAMNGGGWGQNIGPKEKTECLSLIQHMPTAITLRTEKGLVGICHAEWPADDWLKVEEALSDHHTRYQMVWGRHQAGHRLKKWDKTAIATVHGHYVVDRIHYLGTSCFIDTGCIYGGPLTLKTVDALLESMS